jgi:hypothetical protein
MYEEFHTDPMRTIRLRPYRDPAAARFTLRLYDTGRTGSDGKYVVRYTLTQHLGKPGHATSTVIFDESRFRCSPLNAIDSDACVAAILGFVTLRPGDTDAEYFADYTDQQREFAAEHAESLACCDQRFMDL